MPIKKKLLKFLCERQKEKRQMYRGIRRGIRDLQHGRVIYYIKDKINNKS